MSATQARGIQTAQKRVSMITTSASPHSLFVRMWTLVDAGEGLGQANPRKTSELEVYNIGEGICHGTAGRWRDRDDIEWSDTFTSLTITGVPENGLGGATSADFATIPIAFKTALNILLSGSFFSPNECPSEAAFAIYQIQQIIDVQTLGLGDVAVGGMPWGQGNDNVRVHDAAMGVTSSLMDAIRLELMRHVEQVFELQTLLPKVPGIVTVSRIKPEMLGEVARNEFMRSLVK